MADELNVDVSTVSKRLKAMGVIQRQRYWVPYQLKPRDIERRLVVFRLMCHALVEKRFQSFEVIKKWVDSWIASKDKEFFRNEIRQLPEKCRNVITSDGQYFQ